jgi:hypothetical protein
MPGTPITNPEEFVAVLQALAITKTTFSLVLSRSIFPRAWRLEGRLLWHTKESLERQFFAVERTFVTIGSRNCATLCKSQLANPASIVTASSVALRSSVV